MDSSDVEKTEDKTYFKIENITVVRPPLLKVYYWRSLDIQGLNEKLTRFDSNHIEHSLSLPTRQLNSQPLKIIFWIRNHDKRPISLKLKRLQNCQCVPLETRVGFNQFRLLYHCPHRRLINISQELYNLEANDLVAMTMVAYFYLFGSHELSYEMSCSDSRIVIWNFHMNIVTFDPVRSVLTQELLPVNIKEYRRMSQAIWIRNITMQNLQFRFKARDRGFCLINANMVVPRQSVWPLIVDYRPSDFENDFTLIMNFDGFRYNIPLTCRGILNDEYPPDLEFPTFDYECSDFPYVIYPNKLKFQMELNEDRSLMVALHNHNHKGMEFKWQTYSINGYFTFTFQPTQFTLKPHHTKLCVVHCKTYDKPLNFRYLPAVLEVHKILDKSTQIAQQLLTDIESIDDPKWREDSYVEHIFLHIDLKVNFPKIETIALNGIDEKSIQSPLTTSSMPESLVASMKENNIITIFEKLFWDYLSRSNFMRNTEKIPRDLSYEDVVSQRSSENRRNSKNISNNSRGIFSIISDILSESCRDLSKNHRFVPMDILETP